MNNTSLSIPEVKLLRPELFQDYRGYTSVLFDTMISKVLHLRIVQINQGYSIEPYTLRGLHYQELNHAQAKLVSCLYGSIYNVALDIRKNSPTFGQYVAEILSSNNQKMMYIPKGFAHGYLTLESNTLMQWCVDSDFCAESAKCVKWDSCGIKWPGKSEDYIISDKDKNGISLINLQ